MGTKREAGDSISEEEAAGRAGVTLIRDAARDPPAPFDVQSPPLWDGPSGPHAPTGLPHGLAPHSEIQYQKKAVIIAR